MPRRSEGEVARRVATLKERLCGLLGVPSSSLVSVQKGLRQGVCFLRRMAMMITSMDDWMDGKEGKKLAGRPLTL